MSDPVEDIAAACLCLDRLDESIVGPNSKECFESFRRKRFNRTMDKLKVRSVIRTKFLDKGSCSSISKIKVKMPDGILPS
jgi:hypothetical protein